MSFVSQGWDANLHSRAVLSLLLSSPYKTATSWKSRLLGEALNRYVLRVLCADNTNFLKSISTANSVLYNSLWRFLAVREYVDKNHKLTAWGKVLATVISALKDKRELEEAAVLAVELLRLGLLNGDENMFPGYKGAPLRGNGMHVPSHVVDDPELRANLRRNGSPVQPPHFPRCGLGNPAS